MKKFMTLAMATALTAALAVPAFADGTTQGTITYDFETYGTYDSADEWGQVWIQTWGGTTSIDSAYVTLTDGSTVAATPEDGVIAIIGDGAVVEDYTTVASVTFVLNYDSDELSDEETWIGGGVGLNSTSTGWLSIEWGKASGEKAIVLEDGLLDSEPTGDTAPVAYLAAVVALAGVALVASKKARA